MHRKKLTPEQENHIACARASSAISGYDLLTEEEHAELVLEADAPGGGCDTVRRLVQKAVTEGRSEEDVFLEHFGPPSFHCPKV